MIGVGFAAAALGSGKFTPLKPTLEYLGSGQSNLRTFRISPFDPTLIYEIIAGSGTISGDILTVADGGITEATLVARNQKGTVNSPGVRALRRNPVFNPSQTICGFRGGFPATFIYTNFPDGFWSWECPGCDSGGGQWGVGVCRCCEQTQPFWSDFRSTYNWSGTNYTNGQGEWWNII